VALASCSPVVVIANSAEFFIPPVMKHWEKEWCEDMKEKDKVQWTATEAKDFAKNCILPK